MSLLQLAELSELLDFTFFSKSECFLYDLLVLN